MIEGSSLDPDPAGSPLAATGPGGMETSRGGSFRDCAGNRVDARIANNHIGPATITALPNIFSQLSIYTAGELDYLNDESSPLYGSEKKSLKLYEKNSTTRLRC